MINKNTQTKTNLNKQSKISELKCKTAQSKHELNK